MRVASPPPPTHTPPPPCPELCPTAHAFCGGSEYGLCSLLRLCCRVRWPVPGPACGQVPAPGCPRRPGGWRWFPALLSPWVRRSCLRRLFEDEAPPLAHGLDGGVGQVGGGGGGGRICHGCTCFVFQSATALLESAAGAVLHPATQPTTVLVVRPLGHGSAPRAGCPAVHCRGRRVRPPGRAGRWRHWRRRHGRRRHGRRRRWRRRHGRRRRWRRRGGRLLGCVAARKGGSLRGSCAVPRRPLLHPPPHPPPPRPSMRVALRAALFAPCFCWACALTWLIPPPARITPPPPLPPSPACAVQGGRLRGTPTATMTGAITSMVTTRPGMACAGVSQRPYSRARPASARWRTAGCAGLACWGAAAAAEALV